MCASYPAKTAVLSLYFDFISYFFSFFFFSDTNPASTTLSLILKIKCYLLLSSGCLSSGRTKWWVANRYIRVLKAKIAVHSDQKEIIHVWEETSWAFLRVSRLSALQFVGEHLVAACLFKSQTVCKETTVCTLNVVIVGPSHSSGLHGWHRLCFKSE